MTGSSSWGSLTLDGSVYSGVEVIVRDICGNSQHEDATLEYRTTHEMKGIIPEDVEPGGGVAVQNGASINKAGGYIGGHWAEIRKIVSPI